MRSRRVVCVVLMEWLVLRVAAQSASTMLLSSTSSSLRSGNGLFKAGFISVNPLAPPVYTLGIWYDFSMSDTKVVWVASRSMALIAIGSSDTIATHTVATLSLSAHGDLQALDNTVTPPKLMWRSNTENKNVVSATIEDTGNLVLRTAANLTVWQSFDSPTDTLMPGQRFSANSTAKNLTAWATASDWSDGNYSLAWRTDPENVVLEAFWKNPYSRVERQTYYWQLNGASGVATNVAHLTPDGLFQGGSTKAHLTLDTDGNFRIYSWSDTELRWNIEWKALDDECDIHGYCGPFSTCNIDAVCECPQMFQFVDNQDKRLGCQRTEPAAYCNSTGSPRDAFVQVMDVDWFYSDLETAIDVDNQTCLRRCSESCDCLAAIFDTSVSSDGTNAKCWHKKDVLLNGRAKVNTSSFLRTCSCSDIVPTSGPKSRTTLWILVGTSGGALVVAIACCGIYFYARQYFLYPADKAFQARLRAKGRNSVAFSEAMIGSATRNYKTLLGRGGFGDVFYGKLPDGTEVAVKVLSAMSQQSKQEFYNEIELLSKVHQKYVVSLMGYSSTRKHQILVYEFLSGGNLQQRLQGGVVTASPTAVDNRLKAPDHPLTWQQRTRIILHIAEGLEYLHHKCSPPIIHRDIKSSNILLTSNMIAKVADFGLSKMKTVGNDDATHVTTAVKGTWGYLDPDYQLTGMLTEKSDVYAFGVVLLEILTGRNHIYIVQRVRNAWRLEQFEDIADPNVRDAYDTKELINLVELALWCTRLGSTERPSMDQVVRRLHEILLPPLEPSNMSAEDGHWPQNALVARWARVTSWSQNEPSFDSVPRRETQVFSESPTTCRMSSEVHRQY